MKFYTKDEIISMIKKHELADIRKYNAPNDTAIHDDKYHQIGFNAGLYGCNAEIYIDKKTGEKFVYIMRIDLPKYVKTILSNN